MFDNIPCYLDRYDCNVGYFVTRCLFIFLLGANRSKELISLDHLAVRTKMSYTSTASTMVVRIRVSNSWYAWRLNVTYIGIRRGMFNNFSYILHIVYIATLKGQNRYNITNWECNQMKNKKCRRYNNIQTETCK